MFLKNNSPDFYALTSCIVLGKRNLFLARLPGISAIRMKIIDVITSRLLLIFTEILNFRKIHNGANKHYLQ